MSAEQRWSRLGRWTGASGLVGTVLLFVPIIALSTLGEPPLHAPEREVVEFFGQVSDTSWAEAAAATTVIGSLALSWSLVGVALIVRRAEGDPAWRATVAVLSVGVFAATMVGNVGWSVAGLHGRELDPGLLHFAYDSGNISFANVWLALASFALACGWVTLETGVLPRWTGWLAVASAAGFVVARCFWTGSVWFAPYSAFWVWLLTVLVLLLRGRFGAGDANGGGTAYTGRDRLATGGEG